MKKIVLALTLIVFSSSLFSQDITGRWYGVLEAQGVKLSMIFNINKDGQQYATTMSIPKQRVKEAEVNTTAYSNDTLTFEIPQRAFVYKGIVSKDGIIKGWLTQFGQEIPLDLSREEMLEEIKRPQEPKQPYPYLSEDIKFRNEFVSINLAGTITIPEGKGRYPAVVLVSGSGQQNRDEELLDHKPFLVLSDYLTRNGIAVLRYDDRGCAESEGDPTTATTADFATDAMAAVNYLKGRKEINPSKIGIVGHSEGGIIAFMLAAKEKDVAFVVSMAGSTIKGDSILLLQNEAIGRGYGMTEEVLAEARIKNKLVYDIVQGTDDKNVLTERLTEIFGTSENAKINIRQMLYNWMKFFLKHDPSDDIRHIQIPTLALFGGKDFQVPAEPNAESFKKNIPGTNKKSEVKIYPDKNHLFQNATTGMMDEYSVIEETINLEVLKDIADWIMQVTK